jgi:hypothetical protein
MIAFMVRYSRVCKNRAELEAKNIKNSDVNDSRQNKALSVNFTFEVFLTKFQ